MTQNNQNFSVMDSNKDITQQSTPLKVRMRSRIPVRSPGGGFRFFGSDFTSSPTRDLGCKRRQTKNLTSPQRSDRTSSGASIFLTHVENEERVVVVQHRVRNRKTKCTLSSRSKHKYIETNTCTQ